MEDKQIGKIAKVICEGCAVNNGHCWFVSNLKLCPTVLNDSERLYNAGYRKQIEAEWQIVMGSNGQEKMVCTNCRHQQDLIGTFTYCPNCGAMMRKGDGKFKEFNAEISRNTALAVLKALSNYMYPSNDIFGKKTLVISRSAFESVRKKFLDDTKEKNK